MSKKIQNDNIFNKRRIINSNQNLLINKSNKLKYLSKQNSTIKALNKSEPLIKNAVYQKPKVKPNSNSYIQNNSFNENNEFLEYQNLEENPKSKEIREKNDKIKEISNNLKENEIKIEKVNKTMIEFLNNKKEDLNISKVWASQMNELEKIQQENLTLKADSIIYREDIIHLSEINKKLNEELEIEKRKILNLIGKGEESLQILNNKNYEINQLTETISNLKLSNSRNVLNNIKDNKAKDQLIYELQFELNNLNNDKIKIETETKILEEQYNNILKENSIAVKEDEIYKTKVNNNIIGLENRIKQMENQLEELSVKNNELKIYNQKINNNIEKLLKEKNNFINKFQKKKEQCNELQNELKKLENKYSQLLYDIQKQKYINENNKKKEHKEIEKEYKRKRKNSSKQIIVNELYNKIQILKQKVQDQRKVDN